MKFKKKPIIVNAAHFYTGQEEDVRDVLDLIPGLIWYGVLDEAGSPVLRIETQDSQGYVTVAMDDWLVLEPNGHVRVYRDDAFRASHDRIDAPTKED